MVVGVAGRSGLLVGELEQLVGGFSQNAERRRRLVLPPPGRTLALRASGRVAVAVDGAEVFGDRVLIRTQLLFRPVGGRDFLWGGQVTTMKTRHKTTTTTIINKQS